MVKRNNSTFEKQEKAMNREKKARKKLARRQGKNSQDLNDTPEESDTD